MILSTACDAVVVSVLDEVVESDAAEDEDALDDVSAGNGGGGADEVAD